MAKDYVILVDENDREIGTCEKLQAHIEGKLHRAISVFIFNTQGEMLIHKRAKNKYHSPSLWTNATCSHPKPGETALDAAHRRLQEEMGFTCDLTFHSNIKYNLPLKNGLTEHEFDHIFVGTYKGEIQPNELEVADYEYINTKKLKDLIKNKPANYTSWFKLILNENFNF